MEDLKAGRARFGIMTKLIIDTTDSNITTVKLDIDGMVDELSAERKTSSQQTLILIEKLLKKNDLSPSEIGEISVNTGPGSFTGTRVGVAIANALGFGLDVKINGSSKQASPKYV